MSLRAAIPVLLVPSVDAARSYFTDVLGFSTILAWGSPPSYAAVLRDTAECHLCADDGVRQPARVAVVADDVDAYHDELRSRGADITVALADRPYGMRDFNVRTPDGHQLIFGQPLTR